MSTNFCSKLFVNRSPQKGSIRPHLHPVGAQNILGLSIRLSLVLVFKYKGSQGAYTTHPSTALTRNKLCSVCDIFLGGIHVLRVNGIRNTPLIEPKTFSVYAYTQF